MALTVLSKGLPIFVSSVALVGVVAYAPVAHAETVTIDIAAEFTSGVREPVTNLNTGGITFTGSSSDATTRVFINSFQPWISVDGSNLGSGSGTATLTIAVPNGQGVNMTISGSGSCGVSNSASIVLRENGAVKQTETFNDICSISSPFTTVTGFDEVVVTAGPASQFYIRALSFDVGSSAVTFTNANIPTAPIQQYAVGYDEACDRGLPEEADFPALQSMKLSGWSKSWAWWPNGGQGGFVCTRQPYFTSSGTWSVN